MKFEKGYNAKIDEQFSIHIAEETEEDLNDIINLNLNVHKEEVIETFIRRVVLEHPLRNKILFLYIKDQKENKLASSICLAPLEWRIDGNKLPICEMEFVGTLEEYRGRGFVKILNELYEKIMHQNGYNLSVIRGIPFYYRSLGYEYVSLLDERISIPVSKIPNKKYDTITLRKATSNDITFIESKYNQFHENFYIYNIFDPECFKFKYLNSQFNSEIRSTYIFETNGVKTNYFSLGLSYDNQNYEVISLNLNNREMITLLQFIKTMGSYHENDIITLSTSEVSPFYKYIISLGGEPASTYGWQIKIPHLQRFFYQIKPIIENRLKNTKFSGLTKTLRISDYQSTFVLNFKSGILTNVEIKPEYPNPQITDLRIPGAFLFKLLLGDRTIDELNYIIRDAIVSPSSKLLIETLFPKKESLFSSYI